MSKLDTLRIRMIRNAAIALAAIGVSGGVAYGLSEFVASKQSESEQKKGSISSYSAQIADLERKFGFVSGSIGAYRPLKEKFDAGKMTIDRDKARRLLDKFRQDLKLEGFRLEISTEEKMESPELARFTAINATSATIKINFTAVTDLQAYAFLDRLKELPGYVFPASIKLNQQSSLSPEAKKEIRVGKMPTLVSAEISLLWIGLRPAAATPGTGPAAMPPGVMP